MAGLIVPTPVLEPLLPRKAGQPDALHYVIERPLAVRCGHVARADGSIVGPADLTRSECLLCRLPSPAGPPQVWDAQRKEWFDETSPQGRAAVAVPMFFDGAAPAPWTGVFGSDRIASTGAPML